GLKLCRPHVCLVMNLRNAVGLFFRHAITVVHSCQRLTGCLMSAVEAFSCGSAFSI
ncbi:hypothetical protein O181_107347, partial [Austropuccinia psidii MF-1]|nr:hypothetical protein [Austropuccinia psidii MF-1]